jgi:O-antigen/teichoic acid export membrane protein
MLSKFVSPSEYGTYNVLMSFSGLLGLPITILSISILMQYSIFYEKNDLNKINKLFYLTLKISLILILIILILFLIFDNFFIGLMKLDSKFLYYNFVLMHVIGIFFPFLSFFFQGIRDYLFFSFMNVLNSLIRLIIPIIFILFITLNINYIIFSSTLASLISTLILFYFIKKKSDFSFLKFSFKLLTQEFKTYYHQLSFKTYARSALVVVSFTLILQIDILIINYYFESVISSSYALASIISKIIFFITSGVNTLILNEASGKNFFNIKTDKYLNFALFFTIFFSGLFCIGSYLFGHIVIELIYGEEFILARDIVRYLPIAFIPYALIQCYEYYLLSKDKIIFSILFIFLIPFLIFFLKVYIQDIWSVIIILGLFGYIYLILGIIINYLADKFLKN